VKLQPPYRGIREETAAASWCPDDRARESTAAGSPPLHRQDEPESRINAMRVPPGFPDARKILKSFFSTPMDAA
jgi:hypothetical protein